jgi:hypothetical protein
VLGDEVLLESVLLGDEVLPELELPMLEVLLGVLGAALAPLVALPWGQLAPTQSDELVPVDEVPEAELEDGVVELDVAGVLVVAPAEVLPVAEPLVPPDAEVLELGVPAVVPADVLPELPLCAHAAQRNAATTAAQIAFRFMQASFG